MSANKYILERSLLRRGDIILTGDKAFVSISVRAATISRYSHAAIYVGGTIIEATLDGVFSKNPQRLIFDRPTDVLVLRAKRPLSEQEMLAICDYAQSKVGSLYALNEAITIKYRTLLKHRDTKRQFCSRLVAKSYEYAGFDLKNLRNPAFCTPEQLKLCKAFEPVKEIVRAASAAEISFAGSDDPVRENLRTLYYWLNKVRELISEEGLAERWDLQSANEVDDFLLEHPEYDQRISGYLEGSGYLQFYTIESRRNPYRYRADLFLGVLSRAGSQEEFIESELSKERDILRRYAIMQFHYARLFKESSLEFFRLQLQLYFNMVSEILVRSLVIRDALLLNGDLDAAEQLKDSIQIIERAVLDGQNALGNGAIIDEK